MEKEIKYIGYYDTSANYAENRGYSLAATNKMDYICKALTKNGYKVMIVSPSKTGNKKFYNGKKSKINDNIQLKLFHTLPWGNRIQKMMSMVLGDVMLLYYLLMNIKKNESILVYHSLGLGNIIRFAKKIKGFKVILEVEEIYQDVMPYSKYIMRSEYKTFASADKLIFATELLDEKLNPTHKPSIVIYGTYQLEENQKCKFNDGKIHAVYAGTLNAAKGGAMAAIAAAAYLPANYHIHIIGFGSQDEKKQLLHTIEDVSKRIKCIVSYDGVLRGEEYIQFLQKCDIGLSTQLATGIYSDTSFPSKILSYMANGLRVVSVRIKAVEGSKIGDRIIYFDKHEPEEIAKSIMKVDFSEAYYGRERIKELDKKFIEDLGILLCK